MKTVKHTKNKDAFTEAACKAVSKAGWSARNDLEILKPDKGGKSSSVRYGYKANMVRLIHSPNLIEQVVRVVELFGKTDLDIQEEAFEDVVASRVYLQVGSFKVCPYSAYDYYEIYQACADGLRSAGANEVEVYDFTLPVTSFFIASIVAGVYGIEGPGPQSFRHGWVLDHIISSLTKEATLQKYVALYANIQLSLWSDDKKLAELLRSSYSYPFDTLEFETDRGVSILLDTTKYVGLGQDRLGLSCDKRLREFIVDELKYNWRDWPIKAFQFAEMFAPYIIAEQQGRELPSQPQQNLTRPRGRPSDNARERRELVRQLPTPPIQNLLQMDERPNRMLPGVPADPFNDRVVNDTKFREQLIQIGIGREQRYPSCLMSFDVLDAIYRSRVTNLELKSELISRKGTTFEIAHMVREELGTELPTFTGIDWGSTRINADGQLTLYKKQLPITDQTPAKVEMAGFPDLLFIIDSSGSMAWDSKGGKGPYDSLLRAIYSVFAFLENRGKAQYMRFAAVNFSNTTLTTPWHPFAELRKVKKLLFKHQNGGTKLDCTKIQEMVRTSSDRFLCLMVTDAMISNAAEVLNTIRIIANQGNRFVLIHVGRPSPLTQQVQEAGFIVHIITDPKQLCGLCLDYAQKNW
jgi:hypothetical protein